MSDPVARYLEQAVEDGAMPGAVWAVVTPSGPVSQGVVGHAALEPEREAACIDTLYDLASLTKPLATALALVLLEQEGRLPLETAAGRWLPELEGSTYAQVSLLHLAAHSAGLPSWRPLYLHGTDGASFLRAIAAEPAGRTGETVYSDLGYLCLGIVVERVLECPLDAWFERAVAAPLGCTRIGFPTRIDCSAAAPTERGNAFERSLAGPSGASHRWRETLIRGEVHDANAHALRGVAGHAGLFGTLHDAVAVASELLQPRRLPLGPAALERLRTEALRGSGRTVGFVQARASDAARGALDDDAPGHVGFTGTSLWLEPERSCAYVLLTNRVHPVVEERDFQRVRNGFHRAARVLT